MKCRGCGNANAYRVVTAMENGALSDICDTCAILPATTISDVFWPGQQHYNEQLVDNFGKPILLRSREHKARVLKDKNLIEAGDRKHGAPIGGDLGNWRT